MEMLQSFFRDVSLYMQCIIGFIIIITVGLIPFAVMESVDIVLAMI